MAVHDRHGDPELLPRRFRLSDPLLPDRTAAWQGRACGRLGRGRPRQRRRARLAALQRFACVAVRRLPAERLRGHAQRLARKRDPGGAADGRSRRRPRHGLPARPPLAGCDRAAAACGRAGALGRKRDRAAAGRLDRQRRRRRPARTGAEVGGVLRLRVRAGRGADRPAAAAARPGSGGGARGRARRPCERQRPGGRARAHARRSVARDRVLVRIGRSVCRPRRAFGRASRRAAASPPWSSGTVSRSRRSSTTSR